LGDPPLGLSGPLLGAEPLDQPRPLQAGLDLDHSPLAVEIEHPVEIARVEQEPAGAELLASHRMATAGDRDRCAGLRRAVHRIPDRIERVESDDVLDDGLVELRMDVVDGRNRHRRQASHVRAGCSIRRMDADDWLAAGERVQIELGSGSRHVFVRAAGSGPWLTLLHAFPTSSWDWARVAEMLEPSFRVLTFDFLGFGNSDKPRDHEYSIEEQADLTEALWRRCGVEETGVVAHDYGATVVQELLARELETHLTGVVLMNAGLYVELARPLLIQRLLATPLLGRLLAYAVTERAFKRSLSSVFSAEHQPSATELHEQWRLIRRRDGVAVTPKLLRYMRERRANAARWEGALERTAVPLRLVWGMADPRSGAHIAEHAKERLPNLGVVALDDVGHYPQLEAPEHVATAVEALFN
jgi:pimeloyl-ACP methyl ester carboxylesterase